MFLRERFEIVNLRFTSVNEKVNSRLKWTELKKKVGTFWERLQEAFSGANAPAIALRLGIEKQAVYKWRNGKLPGLETLLTISRSTGCSLHWLVTGEGPKHVDTGGLPVTLRTIDAIVKDDEGAPLTEEERKLVAALLNVLGRALKEPKEHDDAAPSK